MPEIFGYPLGTFSQIMGAVFNAGLLGAAVTFLIQWRRAGIEGRKVSLDGEAILRTHFADTLRDLERRLKEAREVIDTAAVRQQECENRESKLRERVRHLEDHLEGVYRMLVQTNAEKVIEMGQDTFPEHIVELAVRTMSYSKAVR